ncbi:MAG: cytochrome c peroxidase [Elusimicrobiota bacterium]
MRFAALLALLLAGPAAAGELAPLPPVPELDSAEVALGRTLFFDFRLSGDATTACSMCHNPDYAYTDGLELSEGYPSTLYFRNTPTTFNTSFKQHLYWDGRFPASDLNSVIRDHLSEAHFMQADGRLLVERLRQIPDYVRDFQNVYGGEPDYGKLLKALTAFVNSQVSKDVPLDRYLKGDKGALSAPAKRGLELFSGKGGCIRCHSGPLLSDGKFHDRKVPDNPEIIRSPRRQIVFRRFFRTLGIVGYQNLKRDLGLYAVTKKPEDTGKFKTPSLREAARTAPYMHNGSLKTLGEAVAFEGPELSAGEREDVVEFIKALSGSAEPDERPRVPSYAALPLEEAARPPAPPAAAPKKKKPAPLAPLPPVPVPPDNPQTPAKVELGQMLFFDTRISGNRENSCATCHNPEAGWGDGYDIAHGYLGAQHWRNSQTLLNSAYYAKLEWDGGRTTLEEQARGAILSNINANGDPAMIEERLAQAPIYVEKFRAVFGTDRPHFEDMIKAIAAFERAAPVSRDTPFDAYLRGDKRALTPEARRGLRLFKGKAGCFRCHNGPLLSDEDYHATGVPDNPAFRRDPLKQITMRYILASQGVPEDFYRTAARDPGLYLITKREHDIGKFRTPSLRELKHTAPYMHNGVFATLRNVLDFYDRGGGDFAGKTPLLLPLRLTDKEKTDLVAFLESLSGEPVLVKAPELPGYPGSTHK